LARTGGARALPPLGPGAARVTRPVSGTRLLVGEARRRAGPLLAPAQLVALALQPVERLLLVQVADLAQGLLGGAEGKRVLGGQRAGERPGLLSQPRRGDCPVDELDRRRPPA